MEGHLPCWYSCWSDYSDVRITLGFSSIKLQLRTVYISRLADILLRTEQSLYEEGLVYLQPQLPHLNTNTK